MDTNPIFADYKHLFENGTPGMCSVPKGWEQLVRDLIEDLLVLAPGLQIFQVKEKFGGLRVYLQTLGDTDPLTKEVAQWLVLKAGAYSYRMCMSCGTGSGSLSKVGATLVTRCTLHTEEELDCGPKPQYLTVEEVGPYLMSRETNRLNDLLPRHPDLAREVIFNVKRQVEFKQHTLDVWAGATERHHQQLAEMKALLGELGQAV